VGYYKEYPIRGSGKGGRRIRLSLYAKIGDHVNVPQSGEDRLGHVISVADELKRPLKCVAV